MKGEISRKSGNILPLDGEPLIHLHTLPKTFDEMVAGGHLIEVKVFSTMERVLTEIKDSGVYRKNSGQPDSMR